MTPSPQTARAPVKRRRGSPETPSPSLPPCSPARCVLTWTALSCHTEITAAFFFFSRSRPGALSLLNSQARKSTAERAPETPPPPGRRPFTIKVSVPLSLWSTERVPDFTLVEIITKKNKMLGITLNKVNIHIV